MTPREAALLAESRNSYPVLTIQAIVDLVIEQKIKPAAAEGRWAVSMPFSGLVDAEGKRLNFDADDKREVKEQLRAAGWKVEMAEDYTTRVSWDHHASWALNPPTMREHIDRSRERRKEIIAVRGPEA